MREALRVEECLHLATDLVIDLNILNIHIGTDTEREYWDLVGDVAGHDEGAGGEGPGVELVEGEDPGELGQQELLKQGHVNIPCKERYSLKQKRGDTEVLSFSPQRVWGKVSQLQSKSEIRVEV